MLDVRETHLKQGKTQHVRVVLYESDSVGEGKQPKPLPTATGKKALTIPMSVRPKDGQNAVGLRINASLPDHAGEWIDLVVERVLPNLAPLAIILALAMLAGLAILLNGWGDPSARKGHYEGKTTEEIQADLDQDIAWYSMEISVASHVTMAEGSTSCDLRVENVEANHCDQKVKVWETGHEDDVLFESGAISPGEYLQWVELTPPQRLPGGADDQLAQRVWHSPYPSRT